MPYNGSGVYSLPSGYEATTGQTAEASQHNPPLEDLRDAQNTARPIVAGGTGSTTASAARTALGLAIGTNVQAYNASLASLSGLTLAANKGLYATAANTLALFDLTAAGRALLDDADAAAQRTTLGVAADSADTDFANDTAASARRGLVKSLVDASGIVQRVYTSTATHSTFTTASPALPVDDTIPQITEGTQVLSLAVTPTVSANRLRIPTTVMLGHGTNGGLIAWGLFRSDQTDAIRAGLFSVPSNNAPSPLAFEVEIEAGTTSAVTFSLRVDTASGTGAVNGTSSGRIFGGAAVSEMSITEVKA